MRLPYARLPDSARSVIGLGGAPVGRVPLAGSSTATAPEALLPDLRGCAQELNAFRSRMIEAGLGTSYEAAHAQLALDAIAVTGERRR